ncbi:MAG: hypothetical protein WA667_21085, partial [Candidatus Nitrosopolaris sp.]
KLYCHLCTEVQQLGFGEYRFRDGEAALIYVDLVFLAYNLLEILGQGLISYRITNAIKRGQQESKTRVRSLHM